MSAERGSVTLFVLGLCVLVLFVGGLALDLWRAFSERLALASAADAAAVAGAGALDAEHFRRTGETRLDPALAERRALDAIASQADRRSLTGAVADASAEEMTVTATGRVEFTLLRIFLAGENLFTVTVSSTADARRGA